MPNPAANSFVDSFFTIDLSACWTNNGTVPVTGAAVAGLGARFAPTGPATGSGGCRIAAPGPFDLRNSSVTVHWHPLPLLNPPPSRTWSAHLVMGNSNQITYMANPELFGNFPRYMINFGDAIGNANNVPVSGRWYWRFRHDFAGGGNGTLYAELSADGVSWDTVLSAPLIAGTTHDVSAVAIAVTAETNVYPAPDNAAVLLTYNGGGYPDCPAAPAPPALGIVGQTYVWRDAKGHTASTHVYFDTDSLLYLRDLARVAMAAGYDGLPGDTHGLAYFLEGVTEARLNYAIGPYHVDTFGYGYPLGVDVADRLLVVAQGYPSGGFTRLALPAPFYATFDAAGVVLRGGGSPQDELIHYWTEHCCSPGGEPLTYVGGRRQRGQTRDRFTLATRRPDLSGPG